MPEDYSRSPYRGSVGLTSNFKALIDAVELDDVVRLWEVLQGNPDACKININALMHAGSGQGLAALHLAAMQGYTHLIDVLVANGANVNILMATPEEDFTPLCLALHRGHWATADRLIANGADPELKGTRHSAFSVFMSQANWNDSDHVRLALLMLDCGGKTSSAYKWRAYKLLFDAARQGSPFLIQGLTVRHVSMEPNVPQGHPSPLTVACLGGHMGAVAMLIKFGAKVTRAVLQQCPGASMFELLLCRPSEIFVDGSNIKYRAFAGRHLSRMKEAFGRRDPEYEGVRALYCASDPASAPARQVLDRVVKSYEQFETKYIEETHQPLGDDFYETRDISSR